MFLYTQRKKNRGQQRSAGEKIQYFAGILLDYGVQVYLICMLVLFPLYFQDGYAHIGTDKAVFFIRAGVTAAKVLAAPAVLYLTAGLVVFLKQKKRKLWEPDTLKKWFSAADLFALLYGAALVVSYGCSNYREGALWGAEGWYMGLLPQLLLLMAYFLVSRFWKPRKWVPGLMLGVSAAVFLFGCINRFGIYPVEMAFSGPEFISTVGNINWYCGYAVSVFFFGVVLFWLQREQKTWQKVLLMGYLLIGFTSLVIQGSQSGLMTLAVVSLVLFRMSAEDPARMSAFWQGMALLWGGCLIISVVRRLAPEKMTYTDGLIDRLTLGWIPVVMMAVSVLVLLLLRRDGRRGVRRDRLFRLLTGMAVWGSLGVLFLGLLLAVLNTLRPGILGSLSELGVFTLDENWGSARGATWAAGVRCFAEQDVLHKLVGVGPDCMSEYIYKGASLGLAEFVERMFYYRLTNAHNEWLTVLVDTGLLGLAGFGGMMVCGIRGLIKKGCGNPYAIACGFCLLGYTVNNSFSFQQLLSTGTVFVVFGMGEAFRRRGDAES